MNGTRKTIKLPTSKLRALTTTDSIPIARPLSKYITNGHLAILTELWPHRGSKEPSVHPVEWTPEQYANRDKQIDNMLNDIPAGGQIEIQPTSAILSCEEGDIETLVFTDDPRPLGIDARYYRWITVNLGLTICDRYDNHGGTAQRKKFGPYPIKDQTGRIVGLIMACLADMKFGQVSVDIDNESE